MKECKEVLSEISEAGVDSSYKVFSIILILQNLISKIESLEAEIRELKEPK